jgi:PKD repeat protein
VSFTDQSTGSITSYSWNFGDGGNSTAQNPSHTYNNAGTYSVELTVTGPGGNHIETKINYIEVTDPPPGGTIAFQDGVDGYSGTRDTRLRSTRPTKNYGSHVRLDVDGSPDESALVFWDATSIPVGSTVQSVDITVNVTNRSGQDYEFYELQRAWIESEATWSEYASGQSWQAPGADGAADRGSAVLGSITAPTTGTKTISLNAAGVAVVQSWVDNPSSNLGFILLDYINASNGLDFSSRETATVANRPKLTVTYSNSGQAGSSLVSLSKLGGAEISTQLPPQTIALKTNYPNPFNIGTRIEYALPEEAKVRLTIYNIIGQEVRRLVDEIQAAGFKSEPWDGSDNSGREVSSGVYIIQLIVKQEQLTRKMLLQK